jgi:hypothetical protein
MPKISDGMEEPLDFASAGLEVLLPRFGLELPAGLSSKEFLRGILDGRPGIDSNPALFSWLTVKILNATAGDVHPELASELRTLIAARSDHELYRDPEASA